MAEPCFDGNNRVVPGAIHPGAGAGRLVTVGRLGDKWDGYSEQHQGGSGPNQPLEARPNLARANGAIRGEHRAVGALVESDAKVSFPFANERGGFVGGEVGEVIDVLLALGAEPGAVVANHVAPAGGTGGGDLEVGKQFVRFHTMSAELDGGGKEMLP